MKKCNPHTHPLPFVCVSLSWPDKGLTITHAREVLSPDNRQSPSAVGGLLERRNFLRTSPSALLFSPTTLVEQKRGVLLGWRGGEGGGETGWELS